MRTFVVEPGASGPGHAAAASGAAAVAALGAARGGAGGFGAPFMPLGAGMGGQGGDTERRSKSNLTADATEIFGKPSKTAPPVIGED